MGDDEPKSAWELVSCHSDSRNILLRRLNIHRPLRKATDASQDVIG